MQECRLWPCKRGAPSSPAQLRQRRDKFRKRAATGGRGAPGGSGVPPARAPRSASRPPPGGGRSPPLRPGRDRPGRGLPSREEAEGPARSPRRCGDAAGPGSWPRPAGVCAAPRQGRAAPPRPRHLAGLRAGGRSAPGSAGRASRSPCSRPGAVRGGLSAERCGRAAAQPGRRGPGGQAPGAREPRGLRRSPGGQRSRLRWCTAPSFPCSAELGAAGEQGERLRSALLLARNVGRKRAAAQPEQETVSRCWNLSFP